MKASLMLALLLLFASVTRSQDITGPDIDFDLSHNGLGDGGCDFTCNPLDANTIDPHTISIDANYVGGDAADIVGINDYEPNDGPLDFYRPANNAYYGRVSAHIHNRAFVGPTVPAAVAQRVVPPQAVNAAPAVTAADNRATVLAPYMDYDQAVALGKQEAAALASEQVPRIDVAAAARLNQEAHATLAKGNVITNQGENGALQACDANGADCHALQFR